MTPAWRRRAEGSVGGPTLPRPGLASALSGGAGLLHGVFVRAFEIGLGGVVDDDLFRSAQHRPEIASLGIDRDDDETALAGIEGVGHPAELVLRDVVPEVAGHAAGSCQTSSACATTQAERGRGQRRRDDEHRSAYQCATPGEVLRRAVVALDLDLPVGCLRDHRNRDVIERATGLLRHDLVEGRDGGSPVGVGGDGQGDRGVFFDRGCAFRVRGSMRESELCVDRGELRARDQIDQRSHEGDHEDEEGPSGLRPPAVVVATEVVDERPDDGEEHAEEEEPPADDDIRLSSGKSYANTMPPWLTCDIVHARAALHYPLSATSKCRKRIVATARERFHLGMSETIDELGPVDYVVIEFPGDKFNGEIAPALNDLVDRSVVKVLDLVLIRKDADGSFEGFELEDLEETEIGDLHRLEVDMAHILSEDDVAAVAEALEPNSSAAVLVWENAWAAPFASAVRRSGGQLVAGGRIPIQALIAALEDDESKGV